jgi:hypothetical protein
MEAVSTSVTSVNYQTTQLNIPEDSQVSFILDTVRTWNITKIWVVWKLTVAQLVKKLPTFYLKVRYSVHTSQLPVATLSHTSSHPKICFNIVLSCKPENIKKKFLLFSLFS